MTRPSPAHLAVSMFTVIPVPASAAPVDEEAAAKAILWLPAVGLLLALPAAAAWLTVDAGGSAPLRRLLGAALAVAVLALLTGGLHLDGLADTTDGLGSRRPKDDALAIMRRGDTGPLGAAALMFAVLLQVAALAALPGELPVAGLVLGVVTARTAVIVATTPALQAARPGGFGALVAGRTPVRTCVAVLILLLATVAGAGWLLGGAGLAVRLLAATVTGLLTATAVCAVAKSRLGGLTGDVFGAVIELTMTMTLVALVAAT